MLFNIFEDTITISVYTKYAITFFLYRLVLFYVGSADAAAVATDDACNDLQKGLQADKKADGLCDLAEDAARRIPFLQVIVTTLPPRFDAHHESGSGMKLPNSIRRFMNVQLTTRLKSHKRIQLINSDEALDWQDNDKLRAQLFAADGHNLTNHGKDSLVKFWSEKLGVLIAEWPKSERPTSSITAHSAEKELQKLTLSAAPSGHNCDNNSQDEAVHETTEFEEKENEEKMKRNSK